MRREPSIAGSGLGQGHGGEEPKRCPFCHALACGVRAGEAAMTRELAHGTCVALGTSAVLLRGGSGSGKSDLALRFLALPEEDGLRSRLVADDQVWIEARDQGVIVTTPKALAGLIEVRGLGIKRVPFLGTAQLVLICDLLAADRVPRMPPDPWERTVLAGVEIPTLKFSPFEASAPLKLRMALLNATAPLRAQEQ